MPNFTDTFIEIMESSDRKIGLVLSGGGIRGMAHLGLIKVLEEQGIEAQAVAGTSVGGLIGALYAGGYGVDDMLRFFRETPLFQYNYFTINKPGFLDTDRYISVLREYFPEDSFEALAKKLFVVATDLQDGIEVAFHSGALIKPLLASAALTPVFSPVMIDKRMYADGGILNNFPSEYLEEECEYLIGSNVVSTSPVELKDLKNPLQITGRVSSLMIYSSCHRKLQKCDLSIQPSELEGIGILDKRRIEKAYQIGYKASVEAFAKLEGKGNPFLLKRSGTNAGKTQTEHGN